MPQEEINALLVEHARAGRRVVRLKGGDPFVYGRGGEEVAACLAAGVAVEVVPGLTSVVSVPQAAGIPVTHRGSAASVHVVNGQAETSPSTLAALARRHRHHRGADGRRALSPPRRRRPCAPACPATARSRSSSAGTRREQRTTRTTLAHGAWRMPAAAGVRNPAVIVIGEVARAGLLLPEHEMAGGAAR